MISGSGVQRKLASQLFADEMDVGVDISMPPDRLSTFFPNASGELLPIADGVARSRQFTASASTEIVYHCQHSPRQRKVVDQSGESSLVVGIGAAGWSQRSHLTADEVMG